MADGQILTATIDRQRGVLFAWVPVFLAIGVGAFFQLRQEPQEWTLWCLFLLGAIILLAALRSKRLLAVFPIAVALICLGFSWAGVRANWVAEPVLGFRYYGPIEGRLVHLDRSISDRVRLTLDQVVLSRMDPRKTPHRVRVSVHTKSGTPFKIGATLVLTGHLSPPQGPVEPGGFDFQRHAWFQKLGAVGYTRTPVLTLKPPVAGPSQMIGKLRQKVSEAVRSSVPGEAGGFAAAVLTGDRSNVGRDTLNDLRDSNLAHLLAISGLHMGLLTGFVFWSVRIVLAAVPAIALRLNIKKIAAVVAILAGAFYLALSGGSIATQRAFIMVTVMLTAILADRRALSLRSVAMAAIVVLAFRPEALLSPGFQMSFAATTALVIAVRVLKDLQFWRLPSWLQPLLTLLVSSAVAGAATAPIAAAHFNQMAHYGLLANFLSVPLMGMVIIPGAVLAAVLSLIGLETLGFLAMRLGIEWILGVADFVASLDGAVRYISAPGPEALPLIALGMLWLLLWRGLGKLAGVAVVFLAIWLWMSEDRPTVLIAESGDLIGVLGPAGRVMSKPRGQGFVALSWLENDGDRVSQKTSFERAGLDQFGGITVGVFDSWRIAVASRTADVAELSHFCNEYTVLVSKEPISAGGNCEIFDPERLAQTGPIALYDGPDGPRARYVREVTGQRMWNSQ